MYNTLGEYQIHSVSIKKQGQGVVDFQVYNTPNYNDHETVKTIYSFDDNDNSCYTYSINTFPVGSLGQSYDRPSYYLYISNNDTDQDQDQYNLNNYNYNNTNIDDINDDVNNNNNNNNNILFTSLKNQTHDYETICTNYGYYCSQ